jgi:hypothetical protein
MYCDNLLKEEDAALRFPCFKNGDGVQKRVCSMPDDQAVWEWELHSLEDIRWNDNHQLAIKYCSQDIVKSMRWLMRQPAYAEQLIFASQCYINSDIPRKCIYTEMHTTEWWWETHMMGDTEG